MGRSPTVRPCGHEEYRAVQYYLKHVKHKEGTARYSYCLPSEQFLKIALSLEGSDTDSKKIKVALRERVLIRISSITSRHKVGAPGRPSITWPSLDHPIQHPQSTRSTGQQAVRLTEYPDRISISITGISNPHKSYRCQQFQHSSHHFHKALVCVRFRK